MPQIRTITFDCAGTLVRVGWNPARFACECLEKLGAEFDAGHAEAEYGRLLQTRWRSYQELNKSRDPEICDAWWKALSADWLTALGIPGDLLDPITDLARTGIYGPESVVFSLYEDTLPALRELKEKGVQMAVLSNWDYSLHRVIHMFGLEAYFDVVIASLEEGVEKPEPGIFSIALSRLGASAAETLHVGDHPIDDVQGARGAGLWALHLDREGVEKLPLRITDLRRICEVLAWSG